MSFPSLHPTFERALAERGYDKPTPVQSAVLDPDLTERDLLVTAQTGSGKTLAFGLAMGPTLIGAAERLPRPGAPMALVIAPTRELALQVARELAWLYAPAGGVVETCVGGMDPRREQRALAAGVHIVVGTPGRLRDHLEREALDLSRLDAVVLDEADEMLDMGFQEDLEFILSAAPEERRTLLFSATLAAPIARLAKTYQRAAARVDAIPEDGTHRDIEYRAMRIRNGQTELAVVNILRFFEAPGALVFCATRESVRHLHAALRERGFKAVGLSGEMTQRERNDALQALRDGHARVCVATDVAARGLDLPDLGLVIHAALPSDREAMLHRSGRTGRAGRKGVSVLVAQPHHRRRLERLLDEAGVSAAWSGPPSADEIRERDEQRLIENQSLTQAPSAEDVDLGRRLLERHGPEAVAAALASLIRSELPSPEEVGDPADDPKPERRRREGPQEGPTDRRDRWAQAAGGVWFRIAIGREKNADPKWLLPMICRRGGITRDDIGRIRVFARETKFEISHDAADAFRDTLETTRDDGVRIDPTTAPGPSGDDRPARGGPPRGGPGKGPGRFRKGPPGEHRGRRGRDG